MTNWLTWHPRQCFCSLFATQVSDRHMGRQKDKQTAGRPFVQAVCLESSVWVVPPHLTLLRDSINVRRHFFVSQDPPLCHVKKKKRKQIIEWSAWAAKWWRTVGQVGTQIYSNTTVPPAASRAAFSFSASSLFTLARISWGRASTSFLAWFRKDREKKEDLVRCYPMCKYRITDDPRVSTDITTNTIRHCKGKKW